MTATLAHPPRIPVGTALRAFTVDVGADLVSLFCRVIGDDDPVRHDLQAARAAGHPERVLPPTYLMNLERQGDQPLELLNRLGVDLPRVLHGEQSFTFRALAYVGDRLTVQPVFADYYERKSGALRFIVRDTRILRGGAPVAELRTVMVVR